MRTTLLLIAATAVLHGDVSNVGSKLSGFFHSRLGNKTEDRFGTPLPRHNFSGVTQTLMKQLRLSKQQRKRMIYKLKEITAKSGTYVADLDKSIFKINTERRIGRILFQSDIVLTKRQAKQIVKDLEGGARTKKQVLINNDYLNTTWNGGVFYMFNTTDPVVQKVFKMGVKVWSEATCIDFMEDKNAEDKVIVVKHVGCWSNTGRLGGDQFLSLGEGCETEGIAVHEIGHVLGFFHTMSRFDRDDYIRIAMQNVDPNHVNDLSIVSRYYADVYGLTYDYGSVMHYNERSYSINEQPTLIAKNHFYQKTMGSELISFSDIFMINEHYGCNARCNKLTSAKCANEGFPHPRNCSVCICPSGYGGSLCDQRPSGCGDNLLARSERQMVHYRLGIGSDLRDQFSFCNYMITAPQGKKIEVHIQSIPYGYGYPGCTKGGIEIKAQEDQKLTGYRFCSMNGTGTPVISNSNRLPVIIFSRLGTLEGDFMYRYVN